VGSWNRFLSETKKTVKAGLRQRVGVAGEARDPKKKKQKFSGLCAGGGGSRHGKKKRPRIIVSARSEKNLCCKVNAMRSRGSILDISESGRALPPVVICTHSQEWQDLLGKSVRDKIMAGTSPF